MQSNGPSLVAQFLCGKGHLTTHVSPARIDARAMYARSRLDHIIVYISESARNSINIQMKSTYECGGTIYSVANKVGKFF